MSGVPRLNVPAFRMLDGGTGMNYEQLLGDLFAEWRNHPQEDEQWMNEITYTEERNVIFQYFRPDKLSEKRKENSGERFGHILRSNLFKIQPIRKQRLLLSKWQGMRLLILCRLHAFRQV